MAEALAKGKEVLDQSVWEACAGYGVKALTVGSLAYYFPRGHGDYAFGLLHFPSCRTAITDPYLCKIKKVNLLVNKETDEVYSVVELDPSDSRPEPPQNRTPRNPASFSSKCLDSDEAYGFLFRVPEACAEHVFPPLDASQASPSQVLRVRDLQGKVWPFQHRYGGSAAQQCLRAGWKEFALSKRLRVGDEVVFIKDEAGELLVGLRRRNPNPALLLLTREGLRREYGSNIAAEDVVAAVRRADRGLPFKVAYYPRAGWPSFIVSKTTVEAALQGSWSVGSRVKKGKMGSGSVTRFCIDEKCISWPWKCLEVCWDEPRVVEMVNPWEVARIGELKKNEVNPSPPPAEAGVLPGGGGGCTKLFGERMTVGVEGSRPDRSNLPAGGAAGEFRDDEMNPPPVFFAAASQCSLPASDVSAEFDFESDSTKKKMKMNPPSFTVEVVEGSSLDQSSLPAGGCSGSIKLFGMTIAVGDPTGVNSYMHSLAREM